MIVTDASVWVSHLVAQDVHHVESRRWLTAVAQTRAPIAAPALLLAEVGGAIARRTGESRLGLQAIQHILATPNLHLVYTDASLARLAAELAAGQHLRGADALYIAVAWHLKIPLASWDQEQIARASGVVAVYQPGQDYTGEQIKTG